MILAYADCSVDDPLYAVGYVLYRTEGVEEELLDTGTRIWHAERDRRQIAWDTARAEYKAGIVATRAALEYTNEPLILHLDNAGVVEAIKRQNDGWEAYFQHALHSFLPRFEEYTVRLVHRDNNEVAHKQANTGLQIARDIEAGRI